MAEFEPIVLPPEGIIRYPDLVKFLKTSDKTLASTLRKHRVPVMKLGSYRSTWTVRLEDLKTAFKDDFGMKESSEDEE